MFKHPSRMTDAEKLASLRAAGWPDSTSFVDRHPILSVLFLCVVIIAPMVMTGMRLLGY
jgi:hypothetical protein